jgi:hypothetical protein
MPFVASCAGSSLVTDAKPETFERAGEIIRVPAVSEYQSQSERLGVLTGPKVARRSAQQLLEMVVHVQLFEDGLDQRACPSDSLGRGDRSANGPRSSVPTPTTRRGVGRAGGTPFGVGFRRAG